MRRIGNLDAWIQSRDKIESPNPYHSSDTSVQCTSTFFTFTTLVSQRPQTQKLTTYSRIVGSRKIIDELCILKNCARSVSSKACFGSFRHVTRPGAGSSKNDVTRCCIKSTRTFRLHIHVERDVNCFEVRTWSARATAGGG